MNLPKETALKQALADYRSCPTGLGEEENRTALTAVVLCTADYGPLATGDYVTDQRLGIDYWLYTAGLAWKLPLICGTFGPVVRGRPRLVFLRHYRVKGPPSSNNVLMIYPDLHYRRNARP